IPADSDHQLRSESLQDTERLGQPDRDQKERFQFGGGPFSDPSLRGDRLEGEALFGKEGRFHSLRRPDEEDPGACLKALERLREGDPGIEMAAGSPPRYDHPHPPPFPRARLKSCVCRETLKRSPRAAQLT